MLEDVLRETFQNRVQLSPALLDPAGTAIRRARAIRRRHRLLSAAGSVVAAAALTGGLIWVQDWRNGGRPGIAEYGIVVPATSAPAPPARPTPSPTAGPRPAVDLFAQGSVWTAEGRRMPLTEPDWEVVRAFRVPAGWLLGGRTGARLVRSDGVSLELPLGAHWVLNADGDRVAYTTNGILRVAALGPDGLTEVAATRVSVGASPLTFADERVVIGMPDGRGKLTKVDHWQPTSAYRPAWRQLASAVYEASGSEPLAQVPPASGRPGCLARLAASRDGLRAVASTACGIEPAGESWPAPAISPDGRWLAMPGPRVNVYDLGTIFSRPAITTSCAASATTGLIWESASAVLAADGLSVVRCRPGGAAEPVSMPADLPAGWRFVPARPPTIGR